MTTAERASQASTFAVPGAGWEARSIEIFGIVAARVAGRTRSTSPASFTAPAFLTTGRILLRFFAPWGGAKEILVKK